MEINKKSFIKLSIVPLVLLAVFGLSINCVAADTSQIYVNPAGNDSWDGEYATWQNGTFGPKQTIKNATGTVATDGNVYIANGTYNEKGISIGRNMNIIGESKEGTIINGTNTGGIFSVNGASVTFTNLTLTNGNSTGGGAISASPGWYSAYVTVDNCIFKDNTARYTGGAIYSFGTVSSPGYVTVSNSIFVNNKVTQGNGGAIYNGGQGPLTVTSSDFSGNTASGAGSAIYSSLASSSTINFCRIIGTGNSLIAIQSGAPGTDASLNWWGSNADPTSKVASGVNVGPWLVLNLIANPAATTQGGTTSIIASLQTDSDGIYHDPLFEGYVPDGITSTFSTDALGSVLPISSTTLMGAATTVFTAGNTLGNSVVTAVIDSQTANTIVNIIVGPVVNLRTGKTYANIQPAIDDILTLNGDTISVNSGTYIENIIVTKILSIIANGTVNVQALDANLPVFSIVTGADGSIINGFNITGTNYNYLVYINAANSTITNNTLDGATYGYGIGTYYSPGTNITNNSVNNTNFAIDAYGSDNSTISGNQLNNNYYGISIYDGSGYSILNNIINQNIFESIYVAGSASQIINSVISGNIINGGTSGIYMFNGLNNSITNNNISNCTDAGINVDSSADTTINGNNIDGSLATGNTLWGINLSNDYGLNNVTNNNVSFATEGINLYNTSGTIISGNVVTDCVYDGIALNLSTGNTITGNNGTTRNVSGIRLISGSDNNVISDNDLTGNIWTSISLVDSQFNLISGNILNGNQEGMYLYNSNYNTIDNNTANNNIWDGIAVHDSSNNLIQNNSNITGNNCGVRIIGTSTANEVANNTINGNLWSNISLDTATSNLIHNNTLNNANVGLYLQNSANNEIYNNTIQNNAWDGIDVLYGSNNNNIYSNTIENSYYGERILSSTGNTSYQNNYVNNTVQAYDDSTNNWDNGTTGNYWSDWSSTDPRPIDGGSSVDNHPSTIPF
ncbi:MAG: right-handed parallel beta-helix repeat-containing protein [Methanobacterium sp.]